MTEQFGYQVGDVIHGYTILDCTAVHEGYEMYEATLTQGMRFTLTVLPDAVTGKWPATEDSVMFSNYRSMFLFDGHWIQVTPVRRNPLNLQEVFENRRDQVVDCHSALAIALEIGSRLGDMYHYKKTFNLDDLTLGRMVLYQNLEGDWEVDCLDYSYSHSVPFDSDSSSMFSDYPTGLGRLLLNLVLSEDPAMDLYFSAGKKPTSYAGIYEWDRNRSIGASSLLSFLSAQMKGEKGTIYLDFSAFMTALRSIQEGIEDFMKANLFPDSRIHKLQLFSGENYTLRPALKEEGPQIYYDNKSKIDDETGEVTDISEKDESKQETEPSSVYGQVEVNVAFRKSAPDAPGFSEVAGMDELKRQLRESVLFVMQHKDLMEKYRLKPLNGMLLYGPPGCGKSFIAEKFAEESHMNYAFVKSSDLSNIYLHGSQTMIADLFRKARANAPCILCIDEIDALLSDRRINSDSQEFCREVNEFLTQLNNCGKNGVFVIGTTNRPELLDPAALRAGRLEKHVYVPYPDQESRKALWAMALKERPVSEDVKIDTLANLTEGYVAADLDLIASQVSLQAAMRNTSLTQKMLEQEIKRTSSSITPQMMKAYDCLRDSMEGKEKFVARPRIGFLTPASVGKAS